MELDLTERGLTYGLMYAFLPFLQPTTLYRLNITGSYARMLVPYTLFYTFLGEGRDGGRVQRGYLLLYYWHPGLRERSPGCD